MIDLVDQNIYLPGLITGAAEGDDGCTLSGYSFTGCTIYGPAVIRFLGDVQIEHATFKADEPDDLLIVDDRQTALVGVVGVESCRFSFCRFIGIAFSCPGADIEDASAALKERLI